MVTNQKLVFVLKNSGEKEIVEIDFYGESGKIKTEKFSLNPSESKLSRLKNL